MNEVATEYILVPLVSAIIGGLGWLVKRYFNKRDEDKAEMKQDIADLKTEVKSLRRENRDVYGILAACDKPDCPSKKKLTAYLEREGA